MDFRCCVIGKLYRSNLVLCNRGKLALKCALPFNRMLGDALQVRRLPTLAVTVKLKQTTP